MDHLFNLKISYRAVPVFIVDKMENGLTVGLWEDPYEAEGPRITVSREARGPDLVNCIMHEVMHAVKFFYGPTNEVEACDWDDIEEAFITQLSTGFTQVMVDNPHFVAWMQRNSGPLEPI